MVNDMIDTLVGPLTKEDIDAGWTEASREAMHRFFSDLKEKLDNNEELPRGLSIARGMDSFGIVKGKLLRRGAEISNALHELGLVKNS